MNPAAAQAYETPTGEGSAREHQIQLWAAFDFAPDCQLVTDGHGLILRANHAAVALLRCHKEFLTGKPLGLFLADGHRPRFYESLSRLWQGGASDEFETRLARRGEAPRDVTVRVHST